MEVNKKIENILTHTEKEDCAGLARSFEPSAHTTTSTVPGGSEIEERTRSEKDGLDRHRQERSTT